MRRHLIECRNVPCSTALPTQTCGPRHPLHPCLRTYLHMPACAPLCAVRTSTHLGPLRTPALNGEYWPLEFLSHNADATESYPMSLDDSMSGRDFVTIVIPILRSFVRFTQPDASRRVYKHHNQRRREPRQAACCRAAARPKQQERATWPSRAYASGPQPAAATSCPCQAPQGCCFGRRWPQPPAAPVPSFTQAGAWARRADSRHWLRTRDMRRRAALRRAGAQTQRKCGTKGKLLIGN
jgi:hypothetical protein